MNQKLLSRKTTVIGFSVLIACLIYSGAQGEMPTPSFSIDDAERASESRYEPIDFKRLVEMATHYDCPRPPKDAKLILGFTGGWRTPSPGQDAGIYRPGFVLDSSEKGEVKVLLGFQEMVVKSRKRIPATRKFTFSTPNEKRDGYSIEFGHLSCFESAIQLAMMGEMELAKKLWDQVAESKFISGGQPREAIARAPELMLAFSIYKNLEQRSMLPNAELEMICLQLKELREQFPVLFSKNKRRFFEFKRNQFVDDLSLTVAADPPAEDSVESLLLEWANSEGNMRHLGFYDSENVEADRPVREIVQRGAESIKQLVELADDRRLTIHMRSAMGNAPPYRYRIGDLAKRLLREMAGAKGPGGDQWSTEAPGFWRDWLQSADLSDEALFFTKAAFDASNGNAYQLPIRVLEFKHRDQFKKLAVAFCENATEKTYSHYFTQAVHDSEMSLDEKSALLTRMFERLPAKHKRMPLQSLAAINPELAAELVLPLIQKLPKDVDEPYWTSEAANLTHVVMHLDDVAVWSAYLKVTKEAAVGLRMEIMNPMNYSYIARKGKKLRLAFLMAFLDDTQVRDTRVGSKFSGPCAAFNFKEISVQNFVTMMLSSMILESRDGRPNQSWTEKQWEELRTKVRAKLAERELPDLSNKVDQ